MTAAGRNPACLVLMLAACTAPFDALMRRDGGTQVVALSVHTIGAGWFHACAVKQGTVYCWGDNRTGQLGTPSPSLIEQPVAVVASVAFVEVAAGSAHSCARDAAGGVWCWGGNDRGQLGVGDFSNRASPQQVALPLPAVKIDTEYELTCALLSDGTLWCWGYNREGALGLGDPPNSADGPSPQQVTGGGVWVDMSTGQGHVCGIRAEGTLWCWGRNGQMQLGQGVLPSALPTTRVPTQVGTDSDWWVIDANMLYSCALKRDHTWWCWGAPPEWPGDGGAAVPSRIGGDADWGPLLRTNGFVACSFKSGGSPTDDIPYCFGRNVEGELATGDNVPSASPIPLDTVPWRDIGVGWQFNCGWRATGELVCSGKNDFAQLATPGGGARSGWGVVALP